MTRVFSLTLLLCSISGGLAGPACSKKHYKSADCVELCRSRWGWSDKVMGTDPWGVVVRNVASKAAWDAVLAKACGTEPTREPAGEPTQPVANAQTSLIPSSTSPAVVTITTPNVPASISPSIETTSSPPIIAVPTSKAHSFLISASSSEHALPTFSSQQRVPSTHVSPTTSSKTNVQTTPVSRPPPSTTRASTTKIIEPTPPVIDGSGSSSGSTSGGDIQAYLSEHNSIRSLHGAAALIWSDDLAGKAQQWANGCQFQHSGGSLGPFGENLAAGTGASYGIASAIKSWTDEGAAYDPSNPKASHFTQVVWKATTQVGCAVQLCDGIFDPSFGKAKYFVCEYSPAGNVAGRFAENVQA